MRRLFVLALALGACATEEDLDDDSPLEVNDDDMAADEDFADSVGDGKEDSALSYVAVARLVKTAGVVCTGDRIATAVAVAKAESGFRPQITNTAGNTHGIDRGLFQINSYWHPEVSASCALSASCNTRAAARISKKATRWSEWWTWKNGKHKPFMTSARNAQATVCAE
jgi:Lysozyme like domain